MKGLVSSSCWLMLAALMGFVSGTGAAAAPPGYSGEDAAYIDWAWKSCELKSTQKQRELSDQARNTNGDAFVRAYELEYRKIVEKAANPIAIRHLCETIKDWYGYLGTKIEGLVEAKAVPSTSPGTPVGSRAPASTSAPPGAGGSKRGGRF